MVPDQDSKTEPLREWNRLARENAENAMVSSMYEAGLKASEPIEAFSTWLLIGAASVASLLITSAEKLIPFLGRVGFLACGAFLAGSCLCGLVAKIFALRCKIQIDTGAAVRKTFAEHLAAHEAEEEKIQDQANFWSITLETGIRLDRILSEFFAPFPRWTTWFASRHLKKYANNPQTSYIPAVRGIQWQGLFSFVQAILFIGFLIAGFACASIA